MKVLVAAVMVAFSSMVFAADAPKAPASAAENTNCVKKDKNGKCPALPDSPKPTPKKKAEEKK